MRAPQREALAGLRRLARVAFVGMALLAAGCDQEPMPYQIVSLAVLPTDVVPYHAMAERWTGDYVTSALARKTHFRVVGIDSTTRLIAGPQGAELYRSFRDEAKTSGEVSPAVAMALANRFNTNGLLLPSLQVSMSGLVDGRVALSLSVYEARTGFRVWMNRRERVFRGTQGDPGFLNTVRTMAEELVDSMPRPVGDEP